MVSGGGRYHAELTVWGVDTFADRRWGPRGERLVILGALALALGLGAGCAARGTAAARVAARSFRYRPDRVEIGTVYHYVKSNVDGTHAIDVCVYVASRDRLEVLKLEPAQQAAAYVRARMDWTIFSADELRASVLTERGSRRGPTGSFTGGKFRVIWGKRVSEVRVGQIPFHFYNFDLISLGITLPHLAVPRAPFRVGIVDPTFKRTGPLVTYKGPLSVIFERDVLRHGRPSRRYRIGGVALGGRWGRLWVNAARGYIEDLEIPVPDNPGWRSFKLELREIGRSSRAAWARFVRRQPAGAIARRRRRKPQRCWLGR